ncbi:MAG: hypothetical protein K5989_07400 [Lachnospiraceae bacterium]|nr:hypothetical protein [Lachnospiraceae bacterium]
MKARIQAGYESIRLLFSNQYRFFHLLLIPVIIYILYFLTGILSHTFADAGIPNEYREAANVFLTKEFMEGRNPYALSSLGGDVPGFIYLYGPLYSLIVAVLGSILPLDLVVVHYLVTIACIIGSAALAAKIVSEHTKTRLSPALAFLFLMNCHWRYNYVNAVPDSMALFIMVLVLFILTRPKFRHKPLAAAVLTVAVFFTKQYFLLVAGTAVLYFFFLEKKKDCLKYLLYMALTAAAAVIFIQLAAPLFWTYSIYLVKGPGNGTSNHVTRGSVRITGTQYNLNQIMSIGGMFLMLFIAEALGVAVSLVLEIRRRKKGGKVCRDRLRLNRFDLLMLFHMAVSGVCLLHLGKNDGAWLSYYLQLFMPALIMGSLIILEKFLPEGGPSSNRDAGKTDSVDEGENGPGSRQIERGSGSYQTPDTAEDHAEGQIDAGGRGDGSDEVRLSGEIESTAKTGSLYKWGYRLFYIILICFTIFRTHTRMPLSPMTDADYKAWQEAEQYLDSRQGDKYLYPPLAYYGLSHGIYVYNSGQPFVVSEKFYKRYHESDFWQKLFPYADNVFSEHLAYREYLKDRVRKGEYEVVTRIADTDTVFGTEDLTLHYRKEKTLSLRCGKGVWDVEFWAK